MATPIGTDEPVFFAVIGDQIREREERLREQRRDVPPRDAEPVLWQAADLFHEEIPPREWLLGTVFCKGFVSSVLASGGAGKSALRIAQALSVAIGRPLSGEHVYRPANVLFMSFEDGAAELKRRVKACMLHHKISEEELCDTAYFTTIPGHLINSGRGVGTVRTSQLFDWVLKKIEAYEIELAIFDPLVKTHGAEENDNGAMDAVATIFSSLAIEMNIAVDSPHHVRKGSSEPGNADAGRGATAVRDAGRLVYSLTAMSEKEAKALGIEDERLRRSLVRLDSAKVNITPPTNQTVWFKLVGVAIGNATSIYPNGDSVHTVERWHPPDMWKTLPLDLLNGLLDAIDAGPAPGRRYSPARQPGTRNLAALLEEFLPKLTEDQRWELIKTWLNTGVLKSKKYLDPIDSKKAMGLHVGTRPGCSWET